MRTVDEGEADAAMDRYAEGDDAAFLLVHRALAERLRGYLGRLARSTTVADDLVQETFLRMHRARGSFVKGGRVVPWSYAIARNAFVDYTRSTTNKREKLATGDIDLTAELATGPESNSEEMSIAADRARIVERTLATLPRNQREAFILIRYEGMSVAEAAAVLGVTEGAVKLRVFHAYTALRDALGIERPKGGGST